MGEAHPGEFEEDPEEGTITAEKNKAGEIAHQTCIERIGFEGNGKMAHGKRKQPGNKVRQLQREA